MWDGTWNRVGGGTAKREGSATYRGSWRSGEDGTGTCPTGRPLTRESPPGSRQSTRARAFYTSDLPPRGTTSCVRAGARGRADPAGRPARRPAGHSRDAAADANASRGPLEAGPDETTWVWSDLHLGHDPSIRAFRRPFLHVRQMDDVMFRTWKLSVEDDHTIICLGDATIGTLHGHRLRGLRDAPGHKHLVLGNHDLNPLEDRGGWFRRRRRHDDLRAGVSAAAAHSRPAAEGADRDGQRPRALPRQVLAGPAHPTSA